MFYFPKLLFGDDITWTKARYRNINKRKEKSKEHDKSKKHADNLVLFSLLGTVAIKEKLSEAYRFSVNEHKIKIKKNREILSKTTDCMFLRGSLQTNLLGRYEKVDSVNFED